MFLKENKVKSMLKPLIYLLLSAVLFVAFIAATNSSQQAAYEEALNITLSSVQRAAVQCYALEGAYAQSLQYLIDNYGIRPDTDRFVVHYQYIGENLMPSIDVFPLQ